MAKKPAESPPTSPSPPPQSLTAESMGLPQPQLLAEYEKIHPGFTAQLLEWVQKQGDRRHEISKRQQEAIIADRVALVEIARRGQIFGLVIGIVALLTGGVTASVGAQWAGGFIGGGGVIGLVSVFVVGRLYQLRGGSTSTPPS